MCNLLYRKNSCACEWWPVRSWPTLLQDEDELGVDEEEEEEEEYVCMYVCVPYT